MLAKATALTLMCLIYVSLQGIALLIKAILIFEEHSIGQNQQGEKTRHVNLHEKMYNV